MPQYFENIYLNSSYYGMFYAVSSCSSFISSLVCAKLLNRYKTNLILGIGMLCYAGGQFILALILSPFWIMFSRVISGIGIGFVMVSSLAHLLNQPQSTTKYLSIYAITQTVGAAFGFFLGGIIGNHSIQLNFTLQIIGMLLISIFTWRIIKGVIKEQEHEKTNSPLKNILKIMMLSVFFSSLGYFIHDNWLNYLFKKQFHFSPLKIGYYRLGVGVVSLTINTIYLFYLKDIKYILVYILICCTILLFSLFFNHSLTMFLVITLLYHMLTMIILPMQQCLIKSVSHQNNQTSGIFNATKSIAMTLGPLISGYSYLVSDFFALFFIVGSYLISVIFLIIFYHWST